MICQAKQSAKINADHFFNVFFCVESSSACQCCCLSSFQHVSILIVFENWMHQWCHWYNRWHKADVLESLCSLSSLCWQPSVAARSQLSLMYLCTSLLMKKLHCLTVAYKQRVSEVTKTPTMQGVFSLLIFHLYSLYATLTLSFRRQQMLLQCVRYIFDQQLGKYKYCFRLGVSRYFVLKNWERGQK